MIEKVGNDNLIVQNYTSNFDIKEYIQKELIPKAFPGIPMNKLNLGFTGIVSELMSNSMEDVFSTASLISNEAFITRAVLPSSIYSEAALYGLGYTFATPSRAKFAMQLWLDDVINYSTTVRNSPVKRFILDKDTKLVLGDISYRLDYDIIIDHQIIDGNRIFNVYYDTTESNSISIVTSKHITHQVTSIGWLVLLLELQEYDRKFDEHVISDNLSTTNSDIYLRWTSQIAGLDLVYVTPGGERLSMMKKIQYTRPEQSPFVWYNFHDDNTICLSFSGNRGYFQPAFNSRIESTIYTCLGSRANFDSYDNRSAVPVIRSSKRFEYNGSTHAVAICFSGSKGGMDKGDIELLRDDVILAHNSVNAIMTDRDLELWFKNYARRNNTRSEFFKRRDDPTGRLFSQFITVNDSTYTFSTNTLNIEVNHTDFDYIRYEENKIKVDDDHYRFIPEEYVITPGHLWEYVDDSRTTVRMIKAIGEDRMAMVTDEALPPINEDRPFMFSNPFYIKIHRDPTVSVNYNVMINHTSWPIDIPIKSDSFFRFQLANFSIERSISKRLNNRYLIKAICVPVISQSNIKYIEGIGNEFPTIKNNLRLILITRSKVSGETGYIEMIPIEKRTAGSVLFETTIAVHDELTKDGLLRIDRKRTGDIRALLTEDIYMDAMETSFHFAVLFKDNTTKTSLFNDPDYVGYTMTNRFSNDPHLLNLYSPMNMMRHNNYFTGNSPVYEVDPFSLEPVLENDKPKLIEGGYTLHSSLVPLLKYDIPLNEYMMTRFIGAFNDQYEAVAPVLSKLEGNTFLDFKLFNTYGRSNNYYIGPKDGSDVLSDSDILLDNVYVKLKLRLAVYDRSAYLQTAEAVENEIISYFESLGSEHHDIHVSDLIHLIKENHPNVYYVRFCGFNSYDANKQSIFTKHSDASELSKNQLMSYTPEIVRLDKDSIEIIEEI